MTDDDPVSEGRSYVLVKATAELVSRYAAQDLEWFGRYLADRVRDKASLESPLRVLALPSLPSLRTREKDQVTGEAPDRLVVTIAADPGTLELLRELARKEGGEILGAGVDVPIDAALHWCPGAGGAAFGTRAEAERLIGVKALRDAGTLGPGGLRGVGVNVAIFDRGLDKHAFDHFGGGFAPDEREPGETSGGHGMAMARQVLSLAPKATYFDYAVLPPRIGDLPGFLSTVVAAYIHLNTRIAGQRNRGDARPWVVVNAWSVFKRRWNPGTGPDHPGDPLNTSLDAAVGLGADVVFAAGNCGQFCPDPRCGAQDRGPGLSILGANGHPLVLTVGAVRCDGLWLGLSSQGPVPTASGPRQKPDLCAPSAFREEEDSAILNTGTSAACGVAAGAIAALRQRWPGITPAQMKGLMVDNARKTEGPGWSPRLGHGVLDVTAAVAGAEIQYPVP